MSSINWWHKILQEYASLENEVNLDSDDYKKLGALNKKMNQMSLLHDIAQRANFLCDENEFLLKVAPEELDPIICKEMLDANNIELNALYDRFIELSTPKKESVNKVIIEIRPGTGGDEAALFVENLMEMYQTYAKENDFDAEILSIDFNDNGHGVKNATLLLEGDGIFDNLQFEAGVHRIQRIPVTEANGRIHTSTATVAVLPESEDVNIIIDEKYLRIDVFRAGGAGGQHVNKTESAVRLTYHPPDLVEPLVVSIQDEKSQHKNKAKAMKILRARIGQFMQEQADSGRALQRRSQVGRALRSEKIRTYNFQQNRITDHRCGISIYNLQKSNLILSKDLQKVIDELKRLDAAGELKDGEEE